MLALKYWVKLILSNGKLTWWWGALQSEGLFIISLESLKWVERERVRNSWARNPLKLQQQRENEQIFRQFCRRLLIRVSVAAISYGISWRVISINTACFALCSQFQYWTGKVLPSKPWEQKLLRCEIMFFLVSISWAGLQLWGSLVSLCRNVNLEGLMHSAFLIKLLQELASI